MAPRVATEIEGDGHDIWVWDLVRKSLTRVTSDAGHRSESRVDA